MKTTQKNSRTSATATVTCTAARTKTCAPVGADKQISAQLKTMTQKQALLSVLSSGREFSAAEARRGGVINPSAVISQLREDGFEIYSNPRNLANGHSVNKYRLNGAAKNA